MAISTNEGEYFFNTTESLYLHDKSLLSET